MIELGDGWVHLQRWVQPPYTQQNFPNTIAADFSDRSEALTIHVTPTEARQLAAALVTLADEIEQERP